MSAVKTMSETETELAKYSACKAGESTHVSYNLLVVPPENVNLIDVLGISAQLSWSFSPPQAIQNSKGTIFVRQEIFTVLYWEHGTSIEDIKAKDTKGKKVPLRIFFLY